MLSFHEARCPPSGSYKQCREKGKKAEELTSLLKHIMCLSVFSDLGHGRLQTSLTLAFLASVLPSSAFIPVSQSHTALPASSLLDKVKPVDDLQSCSALFSIDFSR